MIPALSPASEASPRRLAARRPRTSHGCCALLAAVLALAALVGWLAGLPLLTTLLPGRPALSPMTAMVLLLAAFALGALQTRRTLALRLAAGQVLCGLGIVVAQWLQWPADTGLPQAWWSSRLTGVAFALSGTSTLLLAAGQLAVGQVVAFVVLLFAALLGIGHVLPTADLYAFLPGTGVSILTVVAFSALSIGQLLSFAQTGVSAALTSRNAAGRMSLRLLLAGVAAAVALTVSVLAAYRHGLFDAITAMLLLAWGSIALLGAALWSLAVVVDRAELAKIAAEHERNEMSRMVAAAVTHDLRSPLQAATVNGQVLQRLVSDPAALAAVARLQRSHARLDRLFRSLLDSLVVGTGRQLTLRPSHFALAELVKEVITENESLLAARVSCEGAAQGCWDRDALFRVIENLLLNAVKYGEPGTPIACRIVTRGEDVVVAVANRGAPIPEAEWETIFAAFARREEVRGSEQLGWGVGLSYARSVATGHGGNVRVASSGPDGTVFELALPLDSRPWIQGAQNRGGPVTNR